MSTQVSREEVEHVADLARLQLSQEELERFSDQLSRILTYVDEVNAVDTTGIPGTLSMVAGAANLWRDDEVRPSLSREQAVGNAPDAVDGLFRVPQVIGEAGGNEALMLRQLLRSKIHRAVITDACLNYEGSLTVDEDLLEAAGIVPYELVMVSNLQNGERFTTYAIHGKRGSGDVVLNGPTARKGVVGDHVIIFCYHYYDEHEVAHHHPTVIQVDDRNRILPHT